MGQNQVPHTLPLGGERLPIMRVIGQVGRAYVITEGPDGLFLIDQHAAHERILFEELMTAWGQKGIASQGLVAGMAVELTPDQSTLLADQLKLLATLGFVVEPFGPQTFMVRAVPALLAKVDPDRALRAAVEALEEENVPMQDTIEKAVIKRVCKTASIKAGQLLSTAEMEALVRQLENCANPHTCPHGRPTLIHLSVAQLARQFGRT
jgi:DNA mismatch repair protein MutL